MTGRPDKLHVCVVYDCLFPWTIGGAERWYRALAEHLAEQGHTVTYLTLRQWDRDDPPHIEGVDIIAVGPRMSLYSDQRRRIWPTIRFGLGVFLHLLANGGRYDHVHMASFPFFSALAAGVLRPLKGYSIAIDWHEVWTKQYWREYLGALGHVGWIIQALCAKIRQRAYSFSALHAARLKALGREVTVLTGEYAGGEFAPLPMSDPPVILYAGRMIPEKRVPMLVQAFSLAVKERPDLRLRIFGKGPDREKVAQEIVRLDLQQSAELSGFVEQDELDTAMRTASMMVLPSMREGYGMIVVESSARGVPAIVVRSEDNASVELVEHGKNGWIADDTAEALAEAIVEVNDRAEEMRHSTAAWYAANAERLSLAHSLKIVAADIVNHENRLAKSTDIGQGPSQ